MLEQLLLNLGYNISSAVIIAGIKKLLSNKKTVSDIDIKKEISAIVKDGDFNKINQIYNALINNGSIVVSGNITNGNNNTIIGNGHITNGNGNVNLGNGHITNGDGNINIGSGNQINRNNSIAIGSNNKIG